MTKEHFWPKWLIKYTNMTKHKITWWKGHEVYPLTATIPLCGSCNSILGGNLEGHIKQIFLDLEDGKGLSDNEAELFIRWCWKMEGFAWRLYTPDSIYSSVYTIRSRVLKPIDQIRPRLVLAIAFVDDIYEGKDYKPMGLCNFNEKNAIIVSGVISKVAFIVLTDDQVGNLPINYSYYQLNTLRDNLGDAKLFFPKQGFKNASEAVDLTRRASAYISKSFDDSHEDEMAETWNSALIKKT